MIFRKKGSSINESKSISKDEHMKDYLQRQMNRSNEKTPGTFSGMNKKFVDDKYDKDINKRRKGVAKAKASLQKESSSWVQQTADTWNDHADNKHPKGTSEFICSLTADLKTLCNLFSL